jgi:Domain of Unknown Function (DUF1259)
MKISVPLVRSLAIVSLAIPLALHSAFAQNWTPIQTAFDANGTVLSGPVLHFDLVRSDLSITVNNQSLNPAEVANGYVNFKMLSAGVYFADGALPAEESQVPALSAALQANSAIHITAVVNHAALETPKLLWVHFEAQGSSSSLAGTIAAALATIDNPQRNVTAVPVTASELPPAYQAILTVANGTITQLNGAVYEVVVARPDESKYKIGGVPASASLGVAVTFFVQPLSGTTVAANAEFALDRAEIQDVIAALSKDGFAVPALHNHFVNDYDRLFFVHGFAVGDENTLSAALFTSLPPIYKRVH